MSGIDEMVTFVRIDYELCGNAERPQRVPEFVGLRRRAFAVAIADHDERGL